MAPQKIILDTDPGVDDVLAILLSLSSPELQVVLISIVFGNTHAPIAHGNLLKIYHSLKKEIEEIPDAQARYGRLTNSDRKTVLALGEDGPIGGEKAVAAYFHGPDGLSNITETHPHFTPPKLEPSVPHEHLEISQEPSYKVMLDILREEEDDSVVIVALGPLTNLAHALRDDPKTFSKVSRIVWMGGAIDHPGNTSPSAEFNCFADPFAASEILEGCKQGLFELILAPLDITTPHAIPFSDLIHPSIMEIPDSNGIVPKKDIEATPLELFVSSMLVRVRGLQASFGLADSMEMHDPVAVWYALSHASQKRNSPPLEGWNLVQRDFKIERIGELTRGMCVSDRRGTGETNVDRSKDENLKSFGVNDKSKKDESTGRMGEKIEKSLQLPWVIQKTPGIQELRRTLLGRVFGTQV